MSLRANGSIRNTYYCCSVTRSVRIRMLWYAVLTALQVKTVAALLHIDWLTRYAILFDSSSCCMHETVVINSIDWPLFLTSSISEGGWVGVCVCVCVRARAWGRLGNRNESTLPYATLSFIGLDQQTDLCFCFSLFFVSIRVVAEKSTLLIVFSGNVLLFLHDVHSKYYAHKTPNRFDYFRFRYTSKVVTGNTRNVSPQRS